MLFESNSYREYLGNELVRRLRANPRYSQRAFAKSLGLSPGELSELLRGRRQLSEKTALRISDRLGFSGPEKRHLLSLVQTERLRLAAGIALAERDDETVNSNEIYSAKVRSLTNDLFSVVSDWYCFAILNFADCAGFEWSESYISKRLGISTAQVRDALQKMRRLGLIEKKNKKFSICRDHVFASGGIPSEAIRSYHRQILQKAVSALETQGLDQRDIRGVTFTFNPDRIDSFRKEIEEFMDRMSEKYGSGPKKKEVYQLEIALFRLTEERLP